MRFTVVRRLQGNTWLVRVGGRFLSVRSPSSLPLGATLTACVTEKGNTLFFKLDSTQRKTDVFEALGLPGDELTKLILNSLIAEGLPFDQERIHFMRNLLIREKKETPFWARLLSILGKKGIDAGMEYIESLIREVEERKGESEGGREKKDRGFKEQLKEAVRRVEASDDALTLFNHVAKAPRDEPYWVLIPFCLSRGDSPLSGHLSILIRGMQVVSALLRIEIPFALDVFIGGEEGRRKIALVCPDEKLKESIARNRKRLDEILRNLGAEYDDSVTGQENCDGFSCGNPLKMPSFDTIV